MDDSSWKITFQRIYENAAQRYRTGARTALECFSPDEIAELAKIGCRPQELYDFVDDGIRYGEPSMETALKLAALRRDYFLNVQHGQWEEPLPSSSLPPKKAEVDGISWLPRLIEKARRKLKGQMDPDLMYGCAGDRGFFKRTGVSAEEFLSEAWKAGRDDRRLVDLVKTSIANQG